MNLLVVSKEILKLFLNRHRRLYYKDFSFLIQGIQEPFLKRYKDVNNNSISFQILTLVYLLNIHFFLPIKLT